MSDYVTNSFHHAPRVVYDVSEQCCNAAAGLCRSIAVWPVGCVAPVASPVSLAPCVPCSLLASSPAPAKTTNDVNHVTMTP